MIELGDCDFKILIHTKKQIILNGHHNLAQYSLVLLFLEDYYAKDDKNYYFQNVQSSACRLVVKDL